MFAAEFRAVFRVNLDKPVADYGYKLILIEL
jgi:hypothetical protein